MKASLKETKGCVRTFTVTAPWSEIKERHDEIVEKLRSHARLPGFRPGKAPAGLIKGRFKKEIREELIDGILPEAADAVLKLEEMETVVKPSADNVQVAEGEDFSCEIVVQVAPNVEDCDAKDITIESPKGEVTDKQVDQVLESLRQKAAVMKPVEGEAGEGDFVSLTMTRSGGSKGQERILIASGSSEDPVEKQLPGKKPGDAFKLTIEAPKGGEVEKHDHDHDHAHDHDHDHYRHNHAELAPGEYSFTVDRVMKREVPEIDDDLAKDLGADNLEDLKQRIREDIQKDVAGQIRQMQENQLVEALLDKHPFDVPPGLVDRQLRSDLEDFAAHIARQGMDPAKAGINWHEAAESGKTSAEKKVATYFLLDKVAKSNGIEAEKEDFDKYIEDIAAASGVEAGVVRAKYEREDSIENVRTAIRHKKAMDLLLSQASIKIMEGKAEKKEEKNGADTHSSRTE